MHKRNLRHQLKKIKEKYAKREKSQDIVDIMSAVSSKHPSINVFNCGSLTMYQLIDSYKRLNAVDSYFISIDSILAGASNDEVKVKHWGEKL